MSVSVLPSGWVTVAGVGHAGIAMALTAESKPMSNKKNFFMNSDNK
jgi:hypothetical protein